MAATLPGASRAPVLICGARAAAGPPEHPGGHLRFDGTVLGRRHAVPYYLSPEVVAGDGRPVIPGEG